MTLPLDVEAISAAFALPNPDGSFPADFAAYLNDLGARRPSVLLAFAPKAAGTFLRSAAIVATSGQLVRAVHAQGGRDGSPYLPTFLAYYAAEAPRRTLVTHLHMQALPANRHFIEAFDLKPVIMMRSIADMLASYAEMLEPDPLAPENWLNLALPEDYPARDEAAKSDFLIDLMVPWYASYYATWLDYAAHAPERVLVLDYDGFRADPATALERLLAHSRLPRPREICQAALDAVWEDRADFRFNKGVSGRGRERFSTAQMERIARLVGYYPALNAVHDVLIPRPSASSVPASASVSDTGRYRSGRV